MWKHSLQAIVGKKTYELQKKIDFGTNRSRHSVEIKWQEGILIWLSDLSRSPLTRWNFTKHENVFKNSHGVLFKENC